MHRVQLEKYSKAPCLIWKRGSRWRPARRGMGRAQLIAERPDHHLGARAEQESALQGLRRCAAHTATRRDSLRAQPARLPRSPST